MIVCGICAKYLVCKSFVESLNMQNDAFLVSNGGRNIWGDLASGDCLFYYLAKCDFGSYIYVS